MSCKARRLCGEGEGSTMNTAAPRIAFGDEKENENKALGQSPFQKHDLRFRESMQFQYTAHLPFNF